MTTGSISPAGVPFSKYLADPAVSNSAIKIFLKFGPEVYWRTVVDPQRLSTPATPAMIFGSLVHTAVLEPEHLKARYGPCGARNTKDGKATAEYLKSVGAEPVNKSDWQKMESIVESIRSHVAASSLLSEGLPERSVWWDDEVSGLCCKARCDWTTPDGTIVDLKTTMGGGASPEEFAKTVARFGYHIQAAHYLRGTGAKRFVFLCVEKEWPFPVGLYELDEEAIQKGNEEIDMALKGIAECHRADRWPGHAEEITTLSLPRWAYSK